MGVAGTGASSNRRNLRGLAKTDGDALLPPACGWFGESGLSESVEKSMPVSEAILSMPASKAASICSTASLPSGCCASGCGGPLLSPAPSVPVSSTASSMIGVISLRSGAEGMSEPVARAIFWRNIAKPSATPANMTLRRLSCSPYLWRSCVAVESLVSYSSSSLWPLPLAMPSFSLSSISFQTSTSFCTFWTLSSTSSLRSVSATARSSVEPKALMRSSLPLAPVILKMCSNCFCRLSRFSSSAASAITDAIMLRFFSSMSAWILALRFASSSEAFFFAILRSSAAFTCALLRSARSLSRSADPRSHESSVSASFSAAISASRSACLRSSSFTDNSESFASIIPRRALSASENA
mmetsp:Transcript_15060/g.49390  ORF Transcript_15060/g.49390 Transcript_15060/m.49390 type:complete len:355 (-) Transcript_15060:634-1698(-)